MNFVTRYKYLLALMIAGMCAVAAVFLTQQYFEARESELRAKLRQKSKLIDVVVAKYDLQIGDRVDLESMMIKSIPLEYVPDGVILPKQYGTVENKTLSSPMSAGRPLLRHFVKGLSRVEKFSDLLAIGERAITLEVDTVSSIENMIQAGDFIDLAARKNKGAEFTLLLERVRVLSTGNYTVSDPKIPGLYKSAQYSTITLGVNGRYIQDIYAANSSGDLVYLLRNEKDESAPLYELADTGKTEITVLSGGASTKDGVLKETKEEIHLNTLENRVQDVARNHKGRLMRLVEEDEIQNESGKVSNEIASSN